MSKPGKPRPHVDVRRVLLLLASLSCADDGSESVRNPAMDEHGLYALGVRWLGRVAVEAEGGPRFAWSGSGFAARFRGTALSVRLANQTDAPILFRAVVDGVPGAPFATGRAEASYPVSGTLSEGEHELTLYRQTEGGQGTSQLRGLDVSGTLLAAPPAHALRLEVIGDSVSAGFGALGKLDDQRCFPSESHWDAYPSVLARTLGAELTTLAVSAVGLTRNYDGDREETMRELYPRTLTNEAASWTPTSAPHGVLISLGANDINNDKGDPGTAFEQRYVELLATLRQRYPDALILCTIGPTLYGPDKDTMHTRIRNAITASADPNVHWFGGIETQHDDSYGCAYHPNPHEHALIARQLARELTRLLK